MSAHNKSEIARRRAFSASRGCLPRMFSENVRIVSNCKYLLSPIDAFSYFRSCGPIYSRYSRK